MILVKTEWKSAKPNPDEEHLKAEREAEIENLKRSLAQSKRSIETATRYYAIINIGNWIKKGRYRKAS